MAGESTQTGYSRINGGKWATGAGAGAVAAAVASGILIGSGATDPAALTLKSLGVLLMPGAVFGLLYTGIASLPPLTTIATQPRTGVVMGVGYGILFWMTTILGGTITTSGLLASLAFGVVIGLLYALSPYRT